MKLQNLNPNNAISELCRRNFYYFFQEFWDTIESVNLIPNWHIKYLCEQLQQVYYNWESGDNQRDLIINIPPGSSKSTVVTQLYPVWLWIKNPSIRLISSSYSSDLSTAHAVRSRTCIDSDKFRLLFPKVQIKRGEDNKTWYKNTDKGERYATSTGGAVTGMHADFIIIDDPINPKKAESKVELKSASDHISLTLSTRKTDKNRSVTILVMQRLNELDPTGMALDKKDVNHICLPGELTENVKPSDCKEYYINGLLDVNRLDREALDKLKTDLGSYGYAGQILQEPAPEGGGKIKKEWFRTISYGEFMAIKGSNTVNIVADTAYTENQKNDPTALMAICYINNTLFIINSEQYWLELPELLKEIPSYANQHGYSNSSKIMIEPKASGKSIVQSFKKTAYNVIELPPPLDDKITRVSTVSAFIEANRCVLVSGKWNESFLHECATFPNAAHDDQVDNLVNAINYYSKEISKPKFHN